MEGLRQLAYRIEEKELGFVQSRRLDKALWVVDIDSDYNFTKALVKPDDIRQWLAGSAGAPQTDVLKLLCVFRSNLGEPRIEKDAFKQYWDALGLNVEPYLKYLLTRVAYGFHYFENIGDGETCVYYFGFVSYLLMWRYDIKTGQSRGMILPRESTGRGNGATALREFIALLKDNRQHSRCPHLLAHVATVHNIEIIESHIGDVVSRLRHLELQSGFGVWGPQPLSSSISTLQVMDMSKTLSRITVNVANNSRQLQNIDVMLDNMLKSYDRHESKTNKNSQPLSHFQVSYNATMKSLNSAAQVLKQQVASGKTAHVYLEERAKSQSTVLFNLLTHEDAEINKSIAKAAQEDGSIMKVIAKATQEDGSAMKTIAVMTMAFLPATFFAALFALPSLQWNQPGNVIQPNFWVYWVFTIPATLLVFAVWTLITQWDGISHLMTKRSKERAETMAEKP